MEQYTPPTEKKEKTTTKVYKNKHVFDNLPKSKKEHIISKVKKSLG
jgi:hypothetical protein